MKLITIISISFYNFQNNANCDPLVSYPYFSAEGWYIGGAAESCDTACQIHGLACSKQEYEKHYNDVDSSQEVLDLIQKLGGETHTKSCKPEMFATTPAFQFDSCSYPKGPNMFDCSRPLKPGKWLRSRRRLCYCKIPKGI